MTPYDLVRCHLEMAWLFTELAGHETGGDDIAAVGCLKQAAEHLDTVAELIAEHQPAVVFHQAHTGVLVDVDGFNPAAWVRVLLPDGSVSTVHWSQIEAAEPTENGASL